VSASVFRDRTAFVTTLGIVDQSSKAGIPNDGAWHHVAIVHEFRREFRFYVDGFLAANVPYTHGVVFDPAKTRQSFTLGAEWDGHLQYVGLLDRFRYSKGVLVREQMDFLPVPTITPLPVNDLFVNRVMLAGSTVNITTSNSNATREAGEPNHAVNAGGKSIWWTWTAPQNGAVTLSTAGSSVDTVLAVYTGTSVASLVSVSSNDDDPSGGTSSLVKFQARAGAAYQIAVDTFGGLTGLIELTLTEVERPVLQLGLSGRNAVLSWPTNAVAFNLEVADSLSPASWMPVATGAVITGENFSLKLPLVSGLQFYRLKGP
jgi:hypothetical protein